MFYVYILKSAKSGKYYMGYTENVKLRLKMHNNNRAAATRQKGPWVVFYKELFVNEIDAISRERQIKRWKSRKTIERLKFFK